MTDAIFTKPGQPEDITGYKVLKLKDGRNIDIAVMKTLEELHGPAYPTGIEVNDAEISMAKLIATNSTIDGTRKAPVETLVYYIRNGPVIVTHKATVESPQLSVIGAGSPIACMVAFRMGKEVRLGWSVPNSAGEPMPYSKEKARLCAVLRGMKDSITMKGKKFATNSSKKVIPSVVSKGFKKFIDRASRYFKQDFDNYFPNYTK